MPPLPPSNAAAEARDALLRGLADASHELRTPLALVLGAIERLLERGNLSPEQRHTLAVAERNARAVLRQVNALVEVARVGGGAPAARAEAGTLQAAATAPAASRATPAPVPGDARPLVLVVEDNAEMSELVRGALAPEVRTAGARDGEEGLRLARALRPDLVVTEVMTAGAGDGLVPALRRDASLAAVPVLVLTARADEALRARLLADGAQDYVTKPVAIAELRARVRNLVAMKRARDVLREELADQAEDVERLAAELARRRRELQTALDAMRFAREQAERASAQKTTLVRLVSHELRTPLSALLLQVERMRRDAAHLSPTHRDAVARMRAATQRLTGLVESLLEYTRIEAGRMTLELEPLDAAGLAAEVVDELRPQAEQKSLALRGPSPGALPPLETDARLLRMVLLNLVSNGIKFTDAGSVTVSVSAEAGAHHLAVQDTGRGIAPEDHARIFEPFEQLETIALKHTPGVGLGLALVREMVSALGGRITVSSAPGEGSLFRVTLPSGHRAAGEAPAGSPAH